MQKKTSKILSVILSMLMLLSATVIGSFAAEEYGAVLDSGLCGQETMESASWVLYENGTLVISGEGPISFTRISENGEVSDENRLTNEQTAFVNKLIVEEGITELCSSPFTGMTNLTEAVFPDTLVSIASQAFLNSYYLDVYIPASIEHIGEYAFGLVKSITVDENNKNYSSDDYGALYNKEKTELFAYPSSSEKTEFTVPDGVEIIHTCAQYCENLVELTIPSSVRVIESGAFALCGKLKKVNLAEGIEEIGEASFSSCLSLEEVTLPASLKKIGNACFADCYFLHKIVVKNPGLEIADDSIGLIAMKPAEGVSVEKWLEICIAACCLKNPTERWEEVNKNTFYFDPLAPNPEATIYIHDAEEENTAEDYAEAHGINVERTHFYGEWEYDWDNLKRTRKCELCDAVQTEELEKQGDDDVEIIAPENPDLSFDIEGVDKNGNTFVLVQNTVSETLGNEYDVLKVFDITLKNKDGVHVQPDGSVKVKLPLGWEKDGNYKVYRVNEDGTLTDMDAFRQGSHMVFDTDHFSIYIIVEEKTAEEEPSTDEPVTEEETTENEKTQGGKKDVFGFLTKLINAVTSFFIRILELLGL